MIKNKKHINTNGSILGATLIIILVLTAIGISLSQVIVTRYAFTKKNVAVTSALLVAEAGAEESIQELNTNNNFSGFTSPQVFYNEV